MRITEPYIQALLGSGKLSHTTPFDMDGTVTDSTDLTVSLTTGHDLGASFSLTIPTSGIVGVWMKQCHVEAGGSASTADIGFQVNAVDHWSVYDNSYDDGSKHGPFWVNTLGGYVRFQNDLWKQYYGGQSDGLLFFYWDVQHFSMATGVQTCKIRLKKSNTGAGSIILKGSTKLQTQFRYFAIDQS